MNSLAILLVLCSTFMHAGWNILARYHKSEIDIYRKMLMVVILIGLIPFTLSELKVHSLTETAWLCVIGSGVCAGFYLFFLGRAFASSDFTIVYPIARALPVIFIAFLDILRGRHLTTWGWMGITLVTLGCTIVPLRSLKEIRIQHYIHPTSLWMLLAAMGTVGYTLLDKIAAEVIYQGAGSAARYGYAYFSISYLPLALLSHRFHTSNRSSTPKDWLLAIPAAGLSFTAYWLILWAYQLSPYASYIVAFRQFSIVIGDVLAFLLYKERGIFIRLTGAFFITAGLILIAVLGK
jgi:drug/metabolite transporter (DMT)-like permease